MKQAVDKLLNKLISRKLMVWATATLLMLTNSGLNSSDWVAVSLAYISLQGLADIANSWKHGK